MNDLTKLLIQIRM